MLLIKATAAVLLFASQLLPAWCLSIDEFGLFCWLNSLLAVLSFVALWGTDRFCMKNVALAFGRKTTAKTDLEKSAQPVETGAAIWGSYCIVAINTVIVAAVISWWLSSKLASDYSASLIVIAILVVLFRASAQLSSSITKGLDQVILSELVISLIRPLVFVIPLALIYFNSIEVTVGNVLLLFAFSFLAAAVPCIAINAKGLSDRSSAVAKPVGVSNPAAGKSKLGDISVLYSCCFFFLLVSVGLPLMANINTIQLGNMRPESEVALFATASKLVSLVLLALVSANLLIAPKLSPLFYDNNIEGMRSIIRSNNMFVAVLTLLPIIIFVFFAEDVLAIFGSKYTAAAGMLRTLMIGQAVSVFCGPVVLTSTMVGMQKSAAKIILGACAVNWLICVWLIPRHGAMGAVLASVVSNVMLNATLAVSIRRKIGLDVTMLNLAR